MKILITGSTGFVGKNLVKMLEEHGYEIYHLVRNEKGLKNEFLWDFKSDLPEVLPQCDAVVHLAAHIHFGQQLDLAQYHVNTVSTMKLTKYARANNSYFILTSTTGVHGNQNSLIKEDTPVKPENHYALSKYMAEEIVKTYVDNYSILRICGIYGIDGPGHLGLNKAISNAVQKGIPPTLKGTGKSRRNYICVLDVAGWIMDLIKNYIDHSAKNNKNIQEILYIAGNDTLTIEEYLKTIAETATPGQAIRRVEGEEPRNFVVTPSKAPFELMTFRQYMDSLILFSHNTPEGS